MVRGDLRLAGKPAQLRSTIGHVTLVGVTPLGSSFIGLQLGGTFLILARVVSDILSAGLTEMPHPILVPPKYS